LGYDPTPPKIYNFLLADRLTKRQTDTKNTNLFPLAEIITRKEAERNRKPIDIGNLKKVQRSAKGLKGEISHVIAWRILTVMW